jgi:hypothetical protein
MFVSFPRNALKYSSRAASAFGFFEPQPAAPRKNRISSNGSDVCAGKCFVIAFIAGMDPACISHHPPASQPAHFSGPSCKITGTRVSIRHSLDPKDDPPAARRNPAKHYRDRQEMRCAATMDSVHRSPLHFQRRIGKLAHRPRFSGCAT